MVLTRAASIALPAGAVLWLLVLLAPRHLEKAFWYDEVWVLRLARQPSVSASLGSALERGSPIPAGYLAVVHGLAPVTEGRPWMWRLPAMVAAVALAAGIGWLVFDATASLLGAVLGALLPFAAPHAFERYAFEVKPYMAEAAMTVLFVALVPVLVRTRARAAYAWFIPAGLAAVALFSSLFAAAASWLVAMVCFVRSGDQPAARRLLFWGALVAAVWLAVFWTYTGPVSRGAGLRTYWRHSYLVLDASLPQQVWTVLWGWSDACWAAYPSVPRAAIGAALVAGLAGWIVVDPRAGAAAMLTVAITLCVSALGHWPLELRMNLPSLALLHVGPVVLAWTLAAAAAHRARIATAAYPRVAVGLSVVAAIVLPVCIAAEARHVPADGQDVMAALRYTAAHAEEGDVLLLDQVAGTNVDAGVIVLPGRRVDGPRLWRSADEVVETASRAPAGVRAWLPVTHALDRLNGLDSCEFAGGRLFRRVWSGRGTAVFVAEAAPPVRVP